MARIRIQIENILEEGVCPFGYKIGDIFEFDVTERMVTFPNFCGWAYHEMFPILTSLRYGAHLPFSPEGKTAKVTCSDSRNPVVFRISIVEGACFPNEAFPRFGIVPRDSEADRWTAVSPVNQHTKKRRVK